MTTGDRAWLRVTILFAVTTVAATWPQIIQPAGIPPHRDAWLNMWRVAWVAHQLPRDPIRLFDANIHYPERWTLAYSDATLVPGLLASPPLWVGIPTPYVHTALVLVSFVFAGVSAWALVRRLTDSNLAGMVAGIVFAFTPYRFDHYMHLELLWTGWMPLTLLAVHEAVERGALKSGVTAGLLFAAQGLSCIYYGVFFGTVLAVMTVVLIAGRPLADVRRAALALGCAAALAGVLLFAYFAPYRAARDTVGERTEGEALIYSAGPAHYLASTPENFLYGRFADRLGRPEKRLFPGIIAVTLAAVGLWPPLTRRRVAYLAGWLLAVDLSFGPNGLTFPWLREYVLPFRGLRVPARAGGVSILMIAVLAGAGWARFEQNRPWRVRALSRPLAALVLAALALEYVAIPQTLIAAPTVASPVYEWLGRQQGAVIELPMPDEHSLPGYDAEFMYQSTFHWLPLVNGYSGNVPDSYVEVLRHMRGFPSDAGIGLLRGIGVRYVVVHERLYGSNRYREVTSALDARSDIVKKQSFGHAGDQVSVYSPTAAIHD